MPYIPDEQYEKTIERLQDSIERLDTDIYNLKRDFNNHNHNGINSKELNRGLITLPASFESGEQGTYKVYIPFSCFISKVYAVVIRNIAGTDNGTITISSSAGTISTLTITAGSTVGTEFSDTSPSGLLIGKDSYIQVQTSKTTAGGKVLLTLHYVRT